MEQNINFMFIVVLNVKIKCTKKKSTHIDLVKYVIGILIIITDYNYEHL